MKLPQSILDQYRERIDREHQELVARVAERTGCDRDRLSDAIWAERLQLVELNVEVSRG